MARRLFTPRIARPRRSYDWEGVTTTALGLVAAGVVQAQLFTADRAETIQRIRGSILLWLDGTGSAVGDAAIVAIGLIVASTGASIAIDPITEPGANWIYHRYFTLAAEGVIGTAAGQQGAGVHRVEIDNKSMRRFREDEALFIVTSNLSIVGAPIINEIAGIRVLAGH